MKNRICSMCLFLLGACFFCAFISCQLARPIGAPIESVRINDGIYTGKSRSGPNSATVRVTLKDGKIQGVEVLQHFASWKGRIVEETIPRKIVSEQSTRVDAVSGATNSSVVLMNAVQDAIQKASQHSESKGMDEK